VPLLKPVHQTPWRFNAESSVRYRVGLLVPPGGHDFGCGDARRLSTIGCSARGMATREIRCGGGGADVIAWCRSTRARRHCDRVQIGWRRQARRRGRTSGERHDVDARYADVRLNQHHTDCNTRSVRRRRSPWNGRHLAIQRAVARRRWIEFGRILINGAVNSLTEPPRRRIQVLNTPMNDVEVRMVDPPGLYCAR
jgi:hypothetical protein